jgi:hypothetical protein
MQLLLAKLQRILDLVFADMHGKLFVSNYDILLK